MKIKSALFALALSLSCFASADVIEFEAILDTDQEVGGLTAPSFGMGLGLGSWDTESSTLSWGLLLMALSGDPLAAHIHNAPAGVNGPVIVDLGAPSLVGLGTAGYLGSAMLADFEAQIAELIAGNWYFNIHTAANPAGEIRGQIAVTSITTTPVPAPGTLALMMMGMALVLGTRVRTQR